MQMAGPHWPCKHGAGLPGKAWQHRFLTDRNAAVRISRRIRFPPNSRRNLPQRLLTGADRLECARPHGPAPDAHSRPANGHRLGRTRHGAAAAARPRRHPAGVLQQSSRSPVGGGKAKERGSDHRRWKSETAHAAFSSCMTGRQTSTRRHGSSPCSTGAAAPWPPDDVISRRAGKCPPWAKQKPASGGAGSGRP